MADAADRHFRMVDEQESIRRMKAAIQVLNDAGAGFVVEGGWAVTSYGSTVPSVDLDVLVPGGLTPQLAERIEEATGFQMYSQSTRDTLALDVVDSNHANPLIDRPGLAYVPSRFLAGHTQVRAIMDGVDASVPNAPQLTFMKLKAMHDRLLQWRAARGERFLLAAMPEDERTRTMQRGDAHWLRKAGKDLFDVAFLVAEHTTLDDVAQAAPQEMWPKVSTAIVDVPLPVRAFAEAMAKRANVSFKMPS